jgi:quercetin dioxygenase-like cupin family protein
MPAPEIRPFERPDWEPVPMGGFINVEGKVIVGDDDLVLALLRFGEHGRINPHAGPNNTLVSCIEGSGFTSVDGETAELHAGHTVLWPAGAHHDLWTEGSTMTTLMYEPFRP